MSYRVSRENNIIKVLKAVRGYPQAALCTQKNTKKPTWPSITIGL